MYFNSNKVVCKDKNNITNSSKNKEVQLIHPLQINKHFYEVHVKSEYFPQSFNYLFDRNTDRKTTNELTCHYSNSQLIYLNSNHKLMFISSQSLCTETFYKKHGTTTSICSIQQSTKPQKHNLIILKFNITQLNSRNNSNSNNSSVNKNNSKYIMGILQHHKNVVWLNISAMFNKYEPLTEQYVLNENDVIKMGNTLIKVIEMKVNCNDVHNHNHNNFFSNGDNGTLLDNSLSSVKSRTRSENTLLKKELPDSNNSKVNIMKQHLPSLSMIQCKICLSDVNSNDNPLISPCNCKGTMKYIHIECMRKYIMVQNEKLNRRLNTISSLITKQTVTVLTFHSVVCDLCNEKIPFKIKNPNNNNAYIYLYPITKPLIDNYIVIKVKNVNYKATPQDKAKIICVLNFNLKSKITIGRSENEDISLNDYSASREHCYIELDRNKYHLIDAESKFGTLVNLNYNHKLPLFIHQPLCLNIKNSFFKFKLRVRTNCCLFTLRKLFCCYRDDSESENDNEDSYMNNETCDYNKYFQYKGKNEKKDNKVNESTVGNIKSVTKCKMSANVLACSSISNNNNDDNNSSSSQKIILSGNRMLSPTGKHKNTLFNMHKQNCNSTTTNNNNFNH